MGAVIFSSQPYSSKKTFFFQIPITDKNGQKTDLSQANSNHSRLGQLNSRIVLMLLDSTGGSILRETHRPVKTHRISENNQTFIMSLLNTKVKSIRNPVSCCVWQGKEKSHFQEYATQKDPCADPGDTKMHGEKLM